MANLLLPPTRKYFRIGDKNDYCVLDGGRGDRAHFSSTAGAGRPTVVLDDNGSGHSTVDRQAGLFSNTRTSDGEFQGAVAELVGLYIQEQRWRTAG